MALAALIPACAEVRGGDALIATLPIAGHALVEHQARQAALAGASTIVILVERVPAPLTAAIDRLQRSGLSIEVARSASDAADRLHPDERVLLIADGLIADQASVEAVSRSSSPAMLVVPDDPAHRFCERIDAENRWGGLLLVNGQRLRRTTEMLGDWDLQSTLLRRTVQEGPKRVSASGGLALVSDPDDLEQVRATLLSLTRGHARGWPRRFLFAPLEELVVPSLMRMGIDPLIVRSGGVALLLAGAFIVSAGWLRAGLLTLLLGNLVDAVGLRAARLQLRAPVRVDLIGAMRRVALLAATAAFAMALTPREGWGVWPCAIGGAFSLAMLQGELTLLRERPGVAARQPVALADADALLLLMLPFGLTGHWVPGLLAMALYAAGSFVVVQRMLLKDASRHAV